MAFTEFYCQSGGDNLNAGSTTGNAAAQTYAGGTFVRATGVFTVASGDPTADGVAVGDFASIYTTAGATVATFVGRVTARSTTTITVSLTAISGATSTVSETAAAATCKVGGAWKGPNAAVSFPLNFVDDPLTNSSADPVRINFKNDATYSLSAGIFTEKGPITCQGYSASVGDGGRATFDMGSTVGTVWEDQSGANSAYYDLIFKSAATSGSGVGLITAANVIVARCVARGMRSEGFRLYGGMFIECEAYGISNGVGFATYSGAFKMIRCIARGCSASGFALYQGPCFLLGCIASGNGSIGFWRQNGNPGSVFVGCEAYNNTSDGMKIEGIAGPPYIENCNFVKNGGYGLVLSLGVHSIGTFINCGFGAGTQANTSGAKNLTGNMVEAGTVTYASDVTPWVDPANGDFRITLAAAKGAGRGSFSQTESGQAGAVGYPDIGAAQHADAGGGGGLLTHPGMTGGMRG